LKTFNILIGGEAGQGLVSVGNILLRAITKEGWYLFAHQDYESRIRGGHNFFKFRLANQPVYAGENRIDLLVALDKTSINRHQEDLGEAGIVFYDPKVVGKEIDQPNFLPISFVDIAVEQGQLIVMANAVAAGAIWALLSDNLTNLVAVLTEMFKEKGSAIVEGNVKVAEAGFNFVRQSFAEIQRPEKPADQSKRIVLQGNQALPSGALAAGVKFMSAYPMTPATGVTEFIAAYGEKCSVIMEQAEDEIAAINMAIGAAYAGVRAMTATSGGGFALMTEALGYAGAAEIPVVVINAQRPGPSTGLPTRTEQGDLLFAVTTSFSDFPKAVLAPGDVEEAFYLMSTAFNLAERYQMPVIVLSDQHLADSYQTVAPFDLSKIAIDRGAVVNGAATSDKYLRYRDTDSGISPRLYPGFGEGLVVSAGDEHDEAGHLVEDIESRVKMMDKRMRKMIGVYNEALDPVTYGSDQPEYVLIGFGSTKGAIREAVDLLETYGYPGLAVHLPQVYPLPASLAKILKGPGKKFIVESNFTGQLYRLLSMEFAWKADGRVRRYDGRPINAEYIIDWLIGGES